MLAAGSTKSQRWSCSNVEEEHNAPFQSSKPFFSSSEKPPLYSFSPLALPLSPHLLCQDLSRLFSQLGGWKSDRGETGRQEWRGKTDWGAVRVEFSLTEAGLIASLWFCCSEVGGREDERKKCPLVLASCVTSQGSSVQSKSCDLLTGNGHKTQNELT